jgi:hypothetical protein
MPSSSKWSKLCITKQTVYTEVRIPQPFYCISNTFWPTWATVKKFNTQQLEVLDICKSCYIKNYKMVKLCNPWFKVMCYVLYVRIYSVFVWNKHFVTKQFAAQQKTSVLHKLPYPYQWATMFLPSHFSPPPHQQPLQLYRKQHALLFGKPMMPQPNKCKSSKRHDLYHSWNTQLTKISGLQCPPVAKYLSPFPPHSTQAHHVGRRKECNSDSQALCARVM